MELRQLGKSSVKVTPITFGAWAIGGWMWGGTNERDSMEAIRASIENGITAIDTAPMYGMGYSEELVGKAIKGMRNKVVIATKCGLRWDTNEGSNPWPQKDKNGKDIVIYTNAKPQSIMYECEQSLKRLQTDVIDLYQIHWPDTSTPFEESWKAMQTLKEQGKVRAIGVCNYSKEMLQQIHNIYPVDSEQPPYSVIRRDIEDQILPFCKKESIGVIVYSPLERGLLTGKISADYNFPEGDHRKNSTTFAPHIRQSVLEAIKKIDPILSKYKITPSQLIINWTANEPGITAALVGARNRKQAEENAKALQFKLTPEERTFIRTAFNETAERINNLQRT